MSPFLSYVAQDILRKYGNNMAAITVVFPNKRASLFLNQELIRYSDHPIWSPSYLTISELFRQQSRLVIADPITAIIELHKSFTYVTGSNESIDQFYGWGQLMLADFDDIDKHAADASKVFQHVQNWHEFDDVSFLTQEQKELLQRFFKNFDGDESTLKRRFQELWSKLFDIYTDYRNRLAQQGLAYEGMLYRDALEHGNNNFPSDKYLFIGFNMLHKVEQKLFTHLQRLGKAAFYWDYDHHYMQSSTTPIQHEAGIYIRQYLECFPNELPTNDNKIYGNMDHGDKQITYISALTEDIQARYVTDWLQDEQRRNAGNRTAIVMCNEKILHTAIHCIPPSVESMNVTTGFPLQLTPIASMVAQLIAMQTDGYSANRKAFRLHYANRILRHPYANLICEQASELQVQFNTAKQYYIETKAFRDNADLTDLFHPIDSDIDTNKTLLAWVICLVRKIALRGKNHEDPLFQESTFRMYTLLNRLYELVTDGQLIVTTPTLQRLISQTVMSTNIPFHGEPAIGLQIMGVLETRNLDFDHLLILSCNEGNMPKGVNDSSFIPHAIRKAYGLTTIDNKVAIYSYYFHRLLQRCKDITIMYNKSTDGVDTGEMSQFMLQLLVELPQPINRMTLHAGQTPLHSTSHSVTKTRQVMDVLKRYTLDADSSSRRGLSPTAINTYLRCQLRFYYKYVAGIREQDEQDEDIIDNRIFGNIFHRAAELMYNNLLPHGIITIEDIDKVLNDHTSFEKIVAQAINENLFNKRENLTKMPPLNGMQLINKEVIETYLRNLLNLDRRLTPFTVLGHERPITAHIDIEGHTILLNGIIDRLDTITRNNGTKSLRVVDYKTGRRPLGTIKSVVDIFKSERIESAHSDYILQAMLYSILTADDTQLSLGSPVSPALLYIQQSQKEEYDPTVCIDRQPVTDALSQYGEDFMQMLRQTLQDIYNPQLLFLPTDLKIRCEMCPYRSLCMR